MPSFATHSARETMALGARTAREIVSAGAKRRAAVLLLAGELGSGKTTFVKGLYKGFGSRAAVVSPTFILMRRTALAKGPFRNLYHIDAYRLEERGAPRDLGLAEILRDPRSVVVIEWPERILRSIPKGATAIRFCHGKKEHDRTIAIK